MFPNGKKTLLVAICSIIFVCLCGYSYTRYVFGQKNETVYEAAPREAPLSDAESDICVYVTGEVALPGVYRLPEGSRVNDAVALAGGATEAADLTRVNLAAVLRDGEKITIFKIGPAPEAGRESAEAEAEAPLVNLNTATAGELKTLPRVGEKTAANIIKYREKNGPFKSIDEIKNVTGIGEKTFLAMQDMITV